jgi:hypothetical protein
MAQVSRNNYKLHQGPAARSIAAGGQGKLRLLLVSEPRHRRNRISTGLRAEYAPTFGCLFDGVLDVDA